MQKKSTQGIRGITTRKQKRFVRMEINIALGKNGGYKPSSLLSQAIGRLVWAGSEGVRQKISRLDNFNLVSFKIQLSCFECIHGANSSVERDLWLVFEGNVIVRLFSKTCGSHSFPCRSLLLGTNVSNDICIRMLGETCAY